MREKNSINRGKRGKRELARRRLFSGRRTVAVLLGLLLLTGLLPAAAQALDGEEARFYNAMGMGDGGRILLYREDVSTVSSRPIGTYKPCQDLQPDTEDGALLLEPGSLTLAYLYTLKSERLAAADPAKKYTIQMPGGLELTGTGSVPLAAKITTEESGEVPYVYGTLSIADGEAYVCFDGDEKDGLAALLADYSEGIEAVFYLNCSLGFPPSGGSAAADNRYQFVFEDNSSLCFGYANKEYETRAALKKTGGTYNETDGTITWTVAYTPFQNTVKSDFKIVDVLNTNEQSFFEGPANAVSGCSLVYAVSDNTPEMGMQTVTFTLQDSLGGDVTDVEGPIVFSYKTKVNSAVFIGGGDVSLGGETQNKAQGSAALTNRVDLEWEDNGSEHGEPIFAVSNNVKASHTWLFKESVTGVTGSAGNRVVDWRIKIDTLGLLPDNGGGFTLTDTLPEGLTLNAGTVKLGGSSVTPAVTGRTFSLNFTPDQLGDGALTYTTDVEEAYFLDDTKDFGKNTAVLTFAYMGDKTITVGSGPGVGGGAEDTGVLKKSGVYDMGDQTKDHTIVWTVTVNPRSANLTGVTLTDVLEGTTLAEPVTFHPAADAANGFQYTWDAAGKKLDLALGDIGTQTVTVTIRATVDDAGHYAHNASNAYDNRIEMSYNGGKTTSAEAAVTVSSNVVDKTVRTEDCLYGDPEAGGLPTVTWHIEVNRNKMPMASAVLTDTLTEGLAYLDGSLKGAGAAASAGQTGNVLTIDLGGEADGRTLHLTYKTTVDVETASGFKGDGVQVPLTNNVKLAFTSGGTGYEESHGATVKVPNHGLSKHGELKADEGLIEYTVGLNPNRLKLAESTVVDNIPAGLRLIVDSVELYRATLNGETADGGGETGLYRKYAKGDPVSLTLGENLTYVPDAGTAYSGAFTIRLPQNEASAYLLTYKCAIVSSSQATYQNAIRFGGSFQENSGGSNSSVAVSAAAAAAASAYLRKSYGVIEATKTDGDGGSLAGVGFQLLDEAGNIVASGVTGPDGKLTFDGLRIRKTYTLHEWAPLPGYQAAEDRTVYVDKKGEDAVYRETVINLLKTNGIEFLKTTDAGVPLPGAVFGLYTDAACTAAYEAGGAAVTAASGASGRVSFEKIPYSAEPYYFKELTPPEHYALPTPNPVYQFSIQADGVPTDITRVSDGEKVTAIPNAADPDAGVSLTVVKEDEAAAGSENPKYLSGAEFTLYEDQACTRRVGLPQTTDAEGRAVFANLLWDTQYWIKETRAPAGYQLNGTPVPAMAQTGAAADWTWSVTVLNAAKPTPVPPPQGGGGDGGSGPAPKPDPVVPGPIDPSPVVPAVPERPAPPDGIVQLPDNGIQGAIPGGDPHYTIDGDGVPRGVPPVSDPDYWLDDNGVPLGYRGEDGGWVWIEDGEVPLGFMNPDHEWVDFIPPTGDETTRLPLLLLVLSGALLGWTGYSCRQRRDERHEKRG